MNQIEKIAELITAVIEREKPDDMGLLAIGNTWGKVELQIDSEYFDKCFEGEGVDVTEHGRKYDRHTHTTPCGAEVFCLKECNWKRVA